MAHEEVSDGPGAGHTSDEGGEVTTSFLAYIDNEYGSTIELVTCDTCGVVLTYWTAGRHACPQKEDA